MKKRGNCCFYTLTQDPWTSEHTVNACTCHLREEREEAALGWLPEHLGVQHFAQEHLWTAPPSPVSHTANVRFQRTQPICRVYISYMNVDSTVRCREHSCQPSMIFRACVFVEYPSLVVKAHIFMQFQIAVSDMPLCSPQARLSLLCSALPVSHTHLIQVTPLTCFQSVWLYKDCCPPHTRCQSVLCVHDALVPLPQNSGFTLCVFLTSELCLSPGYSLSLLSPDYHFCVCPPGFSLPVPVAVWFPALYSFSVFDPTCGFLLKTDFLFFFSFFFCHPGFAANYIKVATNWACVSALLDLKHTIKMRR